jgi:multisubunit Na+/H+ antiporter MnhC subunit
MRRSAGINALVWVAVVIAVAIIALVVIAIRMKTKGGDESTETRGR